MASLAGRSSGICLQRNARVSVAKAALPSRAFVRRNVGPLRQATVVPRASETETQVDVDQVVRDLQTKWDRVENKTQVAIYGVGAVLVLWLSSTVVGSINRIPLLPRVFELVGLGYSAWFTYRYLLFKENRQELISDVEDLKNKITGNVEDL